MFTLPPFIFFQAAGHLLYLYYRKQTLLYMKRFVIGILAHVDAGKTTMSEATLYETGKLKKMGRVDNRDAFLDTFALERARGITIFSKQAVFEWNERKNNRCPECKGIYTVIRFANPSDEEYLDRVSMRFSE